MIQTSHVLPVPSKDSTQGEDPMPSTIDDAYASVWNTTSPIKLTRESFLDLLFGRTPLVKEAQFLSPDQSERLYNHFVPLFSPYLHVTGPPVSKVGIAQFEFQAQSADDFKTRTGDGGLYHYFSFPLPWAITPPAIS